MRPFPDRSVLNDMEKNARDEVGIKVNKKLSEESLRFENDRRTQEVIQVACLVRKFRYAIVKGTTTLPRH